MNNISNASARDRTAPVAVPREFAEELPMKACLRILVISVFFLNSLLSIAESGYPSSERFETELTAAKRTHPAIFSKLWTDMSYLIQDPGFYQVVGAVGLAPGIFRPAFGKEEPELTEMWATGFADRFFELGEGMGSAVYPTAISALCLSLGRLESSGKVESFGSDLMRTQIISGLITIGMKGAVNRRRPNGAAYSYPSGHTSCAFATATVVNNHFGSVWGIPAYAVATYIGLSRLQENKHYLSDVIAGAILGTYVSSKLMGRQSRSGSLLIAPGSVGNGMGLSLSLRF